jgi:thiamine monophosphate kinase
VVDAIPSACAKAGAKFGVALIGSDLAEGALPYYATLCGLTPARAHARSGDPARIAGYMGSGGAFDVAVSNFSVAYTARIEADWKLFLETIGAGAIQAGGE